MPQRLNLWVFLLVTTLLFCSSTAHADPWILKFLDKVQVSTLVPGADSYGHLRSDIPVVPALKNGKTIGYVFLTSDFVNTTGYSGKPIHVMMAVDADAKITGVELVKHSEPIVLVGIPDAKIKAVTANFAGVDLREEARKRGSGHDLDIVSGATVTVIIIDDTVVRAGLKVAHALGLGGLKSELTLASKQKQILHLEGDDVPVSTWQALSGEGAIKSLRLDVGQINQAFAKIGDSRAVKRPEKGKPGDTFIDLHMALASVPEIGRSLLGGEEYGNLVRRLKKGENAIFLLGRGKYSFKGSGYVRGGIFDRIQLIQGDNSIRFSDKQHHRMRDLSLPDAPSFHELDVFQIPANSNFDPTQPFRLQLLVQRRVGALDKVFTTFDLPYQLPQRFMKIDAPANAGQSIKLKPQGTPPDIAVTPGNQLWQRIWQQEYIEIAVLGLALAVLTGIFFFQIQITRHERFVYWFRIGFLSFTLIWLGWVAGAQLSIVNVLAFFSSMMTKFSWSAFLIDPLIFILWFSVAASLLFWGRGVFCGWLCPFGALQELTNKLARYFKVPQVTLPWGLHERLWPLKYMIFLGLFGLSLYSLDIAEHYAEIEPFKTAIILKFNREWPFVLFVVLLLVAGLFIERFYCRYLCPLGAALAIPARLRMFDWLKRYRQCGDPCQRCAKECMVQAIHPEGNINPNECLQCLHCQVLYQSKTKCPVCIKKEAKRARYQAWNTPTPGKITPDDNVG